MDTSHVRHPVRKVMHLPLLVKGIDRRAFIAALIVSVGVFQVFLSFVIGIVVFVGVYAIAAMGSKRDPQMWTIVAKSWRRPARYDASRRV